MNEEAITNQSTLKPCPFCGNPSVIKGSELIGHGEYADLVRCTNCSAHVSDWKGKPEDKWNRRTPTAQNTFPTPLEDTIQKLAEVISRDCNGILYKRTLEDNYKLITEFTHKILTIAGVKII
jgi:hypothetical protein